jgi:hypothetical protein
MKLSNTNLVVQPINLSPSYLTNLVKEIVVGSTTGYTSACNQITFDGLDGNADGGYILECEINNASGSSKNVRLFCNNDTTATNYYREIIRGTSSTLGNLNSNDPNLIYTATGVITFSNINISPSFVVNSQSGNKNAGTDGHVMIGTIWKTSNPANITRLDIACEDSTTIFGAGSKFKLYRKKLNPSLILTNRYLSNMVEEKRITADCSSVTFTGLDSLTDGDYYLEASIINPTTGTDLYIFPNGESTASDYKSAVLEYYIGLSKDTINTESFDNPNICWLVEKGTTNGAISLFLKIKIVNGYFMVHSDAMFTRDGTVLSKYTKCVAKKSNNISSITSLQFLTQTGANAIGAGSTFRLYKSNSAAVRPGPGFSAHKNGTNQTGIVADWSSTKITFTTEEWDTHNCYDVANSRFTPTIAGIYQITSAVRFTTQPDNASGGRWAIILFKNGVKYKESAYAGYPGYGPENLVVQVYLNGSTDYIEVFVAGSDNTTKEINGNAAATYFQAQKIG